ncbi:hypothetical protein NA57DRAFT_55565 [Rhizodiscina lignyota]|uniref:Uncharacterized protein n=1 Tax=Rhizodiscina lignyota TaxID=1504668 RepID=A0A9P4M9Q7_9PEZI|nr:hypothetical protein NA57DRAFT_55565 [Rhizodiscina lignyota]
MTQTRKFASLPDLDEAQDIYETPDLTDDTSTVPASTTIRSPSSTSSYDDAQEDQDQSGIDRQHVQMDRARAHFKPARVDARDVDFSDRLNRQRKSYRTSNRRRRFSGASDGEFGDLSDEEDETLERKLARLRREIEEAKVELEEQQTELDSAEPANESSTENLPSLKEIEKLSEMLDTMHGRRHPGVNGAEAHYQKALERFQNAQLASANGHAEGAEAKTDLTTTSHVMDISPEQRAQIFAKAAEFDDRLSSLEKVLGLDANTMPDISSNDPKSILYTLTDLDRHIATINSTSSTDALDSANRRVRQLTQEAERLVELRRSSSPSTPTNKASNGAKPTSPLPEDPEGSAKINALFGTLPTIANLAPSLPMVLERLRTLRLIHANAGDASATLDELEKRQAEQETEIQRWREALGSMEASISEGEGVLTGNVKLVGEWVKDIETRVGKLG